MSESNLDDPDPTVQLSSSSSLPEVQMPTRFGRYDVVGFLGRGGFGSVYEGFDSQLQRKVAIKVPILQSEQDEEFERYRAEAQNLARLRHPGIVSVFDVGQEDGCFYIVTEMLAGSSLQDWLVHRPLNWKEAAEIVAEIADALAHAHARKVIHRDMKPGNIFMTSDRGPVLVDFGLAIAGHNAGKEIGSVRGTFRYMAPEQIEGRAHRIDGRTDIYSLGIVFYQMLTGEVPFQAKDRRELFRQIIHDAPQPPRQIDPSIPEALERVCLRAISKSVPKRFTTAGDMATRLQFILAESGRPATSGSIANSGFNEASDDSEVHSLSDSVSVTVAGRRHVTVLHATATVRGNSEDPSELDPEDQMEAIRLFQKECARHVEHFGGSKLPSSGQELLVCFGYPLSYEDAPRRAVHAAVAIQQAMVEIAQDLSKRMNVRLQVWTSIHSGIVVATQAAGESLVGDVLTLVTKIDRETRPGDVVVTDDTHRLIRHHFHCQDLSVRCGLPGEAALKLYRVDHAITQEADWSEGDGIEYTPLVGRDQEVSMLFDRWELVGEGFGHLVALIGDAGLGKSRLAHVLKQHVRTTCKSSDAPIIEWACSPYHTGSAFYPVIEALSGVLKFERQEDDAEKRRRLKEHLHELGLDLAHAMPLFCDLLSLPHDSEFPALAVSSPKQKELTIEYLYEWIGAVARQRPTLFVVEDLHWVDPSTLDLLQRIADQPISDPYLCLLTFRPEFTTPWTSRSHQTQIALHRLTRAQVAQIIQSKVENRNIPRGVIDRIAERTDGVPLFVEEYTQMLIESPATMADTVDQFPDSTIGSHSGIHSGTHFGSHSSGFAIPATLQGLLMARLDRIGGDPNVVRLAATLGRDFSFAMLAAAADLSANKLAKELDLLVDSQLLFRRGTPPNSTYLFKHALIQDAAYDSMLRRQRQEMHQRIADALQQAFPETIEERPELLAYHRTEAGQNSEAVPLWEAAGSMATQRGSFVEAIQHLQQGMRVLETLPESIERDEHEYRMNVPLGIATLSLKGYAAPELGTIYDRRMELCQKLNDPMGQLHATWAMGSWRIVRDEVETCLAIADRIMKMGRDMKDDGALMEALFIQAIAQFYHADFRQSLESCQRGWELFEPQRCLFHTSRTGQHSGVAHLSYMALNHWYLGQPGSALARMQEALTLAESLDHPFSVAFALHHFGWLNAAMRRGAEAEKCGDRQMAVASEQAFFFWETTGMLHRAGGLVCLDRAAEACDSLQQGLARYHATGAELALPQYHGYLAASCLKLGDHDAAAESLEHAFAAVEKSAEHFHEPELWRLRGQLHAARGDRNEARLQARKSLEVAQRYDSATWELTALLDLAQWIDPGPERDAVHGQIAGVLERFEACDEQIPILAAARAI